MIRSTHTGLMGNILALVQGSYFLLTGLWPIAHIQSFMLVTGPKEDLWLVKTVGMLAAAVGLGLCMAAARKVVTLPIIIIAMACALGFALVDLVYVAQRVIPPVYLLDAGAEVIFLTGWAFAVISKKTEPGPDHPF